MVKEKLKMTLASDVLFKKVFFSEGSALLKMLQDILDIREDSGITIIGYETRPNNIFGKSFRGDLLVTLSDRTYVSIEINNSNPKNSLSRNMIHLFRIHSDMLVKGMPDSELEKYRLYQLNFDNFRNPSREAIEKYAFCSLTTGKVRNLIYTFCDVDLEKCRKLVYNVNVREVSKDIRWGAIMTSNDIEEISKLLGEDMLSMEEKDKFLNTVRELNEDEKVVKDWMWEENDKLRYYNDLEASKEQGIEQGIEDKSKEVVINMLNKNMDYETISEISGKTIEEIKEIENDINSL
ncbi:MAG: PD-(D/E)XK nuclease family transposase [Clostridium sp.]|nr:PD-(D/E)XK nuclease family transposase [Clostridium sp.]